tara:strand:- start:9031 stop:9885 length:855 start_codon:yes stop_codon:yes gene_type:complete
MLSKGIHTKYLLDYKYGRIKQGLSIGCKLDEHIVYKPKQLNIILGHDNVGKSYFVFWYFLTLALKHDLKFCLWAGENQYGQIMRDLIQMYTGVPFKELHEQQVISYAAFIEQYFDFIDNSQLYTPEQLLEQFKKTDADCCLIDPFTGLSREYGYEGNYKFLNMARQFVNETEKTIYISTHPTSESGRQGNLFPKGHMWDGHLKPPMAAYVEGGKSFLNRCDDFITIHRLIKHETMKYVTLVSVDKVKDTDTGGKHTLLDDYIFCDFNRGLGFEIYGVNPLTKFR